MLIPFWPFLPFSEIVSRRKTVCDLEPACGEQQNADDLLGQSPPAPRPLRADRRATQALLRNAFACRPRIGTGCKSKIWALVEAPKDFGLEPIGRIHGRDYLDFFKGAWARWTEFNTDGDLLPYTWPARTLRRIKPTSLHGELGYYSFDGGAPITAGTWQAAYSAAQVALTAPAEIQRGARGAFALCRPPGHHAASDLMGGYCYLNNAAIAAQAFLDQGHKKVAILDVDYHHGNGTQSIFCGRGGGAVHLDPRPPGSRVSVLPRL